jgi:hypothetical protein
MHDRHWVACAEIKDPEVVMGQMGLLEHKPACMKQNIVRSMQCLIIWHDAGECKGYLVQFVGAESLDVVTASCCVSGAA